MNTTVGWSHAVMPPGERFVQTVEQFPDVKMEIEELKIRQVDSDTVVIDFKWKTYPKGIGELSTESIPAFTSNEKEIR